jgi:hypothetical protein
MCTLFRKDIINMGNASAAIDEADDYLGKPQQAKI